MDNSSRSKLRGYHNSALTYDNCTLSNPFPSDNTGEGKNEKPARLDFNSFNEGQKLRSTPDRGTLANPFPSNIMNENKNEKSTMIGFNVFNDGSQLRERPLAPKSPKPPFYPNNEEKTNQSTPDPSVGYTRMTPNHNIIELVECFDNTCSML